MVAELLSTAKWQFHIRENNRLHFSFTTKIPSDILLTKMSAELPSTEQIFTETSRLVPLKQLERQETVQQDGMEQGHQTASFGEYLFRGG